MGAHKGQGYFGTCQICGAQMERDARHKVTLADEGPKTYNYLDHKSGEIRSRELVVFQTRGTLTVCEECMEKVAALLDEMKERGGLVG